MSCILWPGRVDREGYGRIGRGDYAHRRIYEENVGPIPEGMTIDHTCHNADGQCPGGACHHRRCINPAHLEPVARGENVIRGAASRTHCPHGHEYTDENTYRGARGERKCRLCQNIAQRRRRHARKAAA